MSSQGIAAPCKSKRLFVNVALCASLILAAHPVSATLLDSLEVLADTNDDDTFTFEVGAAVTVLPDGGVLIPTCTRLDMGTCGDSRILLGRPGQATTTLFSTGTATGDGGIFTSLFISNDGEQPLGVNSANQFYFSAVAENNEASLWRLSSAGGNPQRLTTGSQNGHRVNASLGMDSEGRVAFSGFEHTNDFFDGLFVTDSGDVSNVFLEGMVAPGTIGDFENTGAATFDGPDTTSSETIGGLSDNGTLFFTNGLDDSDFDVGAFMHTPEGGLELIYQNNQPLPGFTDVSANLRFIMPLNDDNDSFILNISGNAVPDGETQSIDYRRFLAWDIGGRPSIDNERSAPGRGPSPTGYRAQWGPVLHDGLQ